MASIGTSEAAAAVVTGDLVDAAAVVLEENAAVALVVEAQDSAAVALSDVASVEAVEHVDVFASDTLEVVASETATVATAEAPADAPTPAVVAVLGTGSGWVHDGPRTTGPYYQDPRIPRPPLRVERPAPRPVPVAYQYDSAGGLVWSGTARARRLTLDEIRLDDLRVLALLDGHVEILAALETVGGSRR